MPRALYPWALWLMLCLFITGPLAVLADNPYCHEGRLHIRTSAGQQSLSVELAQTEAERAQGLMGRKSLPDHTGMLFLFPRPAPVAFWMKNTPLPLDIIFITAEGRVARVHENARPFDLTPIPSGAAVQYVLEVPAGAARRMGLGTDTIMRHARFDQARAVWPCDP